MYFEIENTPEHIKRSRRLETVQKASPKEERPRLILAPFSRPPQVVFENVPIGSYCEKTLEIFNPSKQVQQIALGRSLPAGLIIHLPEEWLVLEPEDCYYLTLSWTPLQPTALRDTIRFTNENRGRYDVIVVLKTGLLQNTKGKSNQRKSFKTSPGKSKKTQIKKSPIAIYKKKAEVICNTKKIQKTIKLCQPTQHILQPSNKDNILTVNDYSLDSQHNKCPFDSPNSVNFNFDTSEIFSNMRQLKSDDILQQTYDLTYTNNVIKPVNKQSCNILGSDVLDTLTFSPLTTIPTKSDKLDKGPKIVLSIHSDSDFDDSLNMINSNKENETHSIVSITSTQPFNKRLTVNLPSQLERRNTETPTYQIKKIPNTSSPKELNSPNFSINTEFSRISDLSFCPQRFSTERKGQPRINNDTQDIIEDANIKLNSDTYTKDSPNTPVEFQMYTMESDAPYYFMRDQQPKMCRQALFKDYYQQKEIREWNQIQSHGPNDWQIDGKSPPPSISATPLQSIPEESPQFADTQIFNKTNKTSTFTIDRTFDRNFPKRPTISTSNRQSWSKKAVRAEPELWKMPTSVAVKSIKPKYSLKGKDSLGSKLSNNTFEISKINQNVKNTSYIGNVYSQSFTVDPFLSTTYFYDEDAVVKLENEFKRWLNCILTPPADLDSNVEQKIDVGKAWLENRNKEVPLAPTKEQVCSVYHNSHRLQSLRRAAKLLLLGPEITRVFQKLNAQIEKKLIAIRTDRNLHLDVGLQKTIMELLLSYNPLWLRIGLEAIYGITLPLKSNSDIEGLTTFIIQRLFRNPFLRNKQSKSDAPNMLLPAYMEAIKKFTLKKFFMLVFFLDQAKQRKLISHDPCLFCRNAVCKESREVLIRFTRELIAGIGDITKHLRPLGYIVCHKQSYLDEYKYAVNNIAIDLRDGVRLSKVMEIILMKNGILYQLRTPAISRLQKIHNVQVALNTLKEANFVIVGDISAQDIADGHREKTLSLLWQLIHVFRAPLFEKAASLIQMWWKKKYQVIIENRKEEERLREKYNNCASLIQRWWRRIQHDRLVEWQMQQVTRATIVIQKYFRKWLLRRQYINMKKSVIKIEEWYKSMKMLEEAKNQLNCLKIEKEKQRQESAIIIQSYVRRWLCIKQYSSNLKKIVLIQSLVRRFLARKEFLLLKKYTIYIQQKYRSMLLMKANMKSLAEKKKSVVIIQKYYRMWKALKYYDILKQSVINIQRRYRAIIKMRHDRMTYLKLKNSVITVQTLYRRSKARMSFIRLREAIIKLQRRIRGYQLMKKEREYFLRVRQACTTIQMRMRAYLAMKNIRKLFLMKRNAAVVIQNYYRSYVCAKSQRQSYIRFVNSVLIIQKRYRELILMRKTKAEFLMQRSAAIFIQRRYRAHVLMKQSKQLYHKLRIGTIVVQQRFRALIQMRKERSSFLRLKRACIIIQRKYRARIMMKRERKNYLATLKACKTIQIYYRAYNAGTDRRVQYLMLRQSCITLQQRYRAQLAMRKERNHYLKLQKATHTLQLRYRARSLMIKERTMYLNILKACITIQNTYRCYRLRKKQTTEYMQMKSAAIFIQRFYRRLKETRKIRSRFLCLKNAALYIQRKFRAKISAEKARKYRAATKIQMWFRSVKVRNECRSHYLLMKRSAIKIQSVFRMYILQKKLLALKRSTLTIQRFYRLYKLTILTKHQYLHTRHYIIKLQAFVRCHIARKSFLRVRKAVLTIQAAYRLKKQKDICKARREVAAICIQKHIRRFIVQSWYRQFRMRILYIQRAWKGKLVTRLMRCEFLQKRNMIIRLQSIMRGYLIRKQMILKKKDLLKLKEVNRQCWAASKIQALFRGHKVRSNENDVRVTELRRRWRSGSLKSTQESLKERNEEAMEVLKNMSHMDILIRAFRSLELLTEVFPMMYHDNAAYIVRRIYIYMSVTNRSISSVEVLKSAASVLLNLTRYKVTGPKIYERNLIPPILKFMWRFSNSETQLFCVLSTYIWMFAKYDDVREDLTKYLHMPENHKMLTTIRGNVSRMKRMASNATRSKFNAPQPSKFVSHTSNISLNHGIFSSNCNIALPALEPDYGIVRADKPRYFEDAQQAIDCLFDTYKL